jgi:hypothetical protein
MPNQSKKRGRPLLEESRKKAKPSLTIDPLVYEDLKKASSETGLSTSALVTACCRQQLSRLVKNLMDEAPKYCAAPSEGNESSPSTPVLTALDPPKKKRKA